MSLKVRRDHFSNAALEIGQSGENDTLPYDIDASFIRDNNDALSQICFDLYNSINAQPEHDALSFLHELTVPSERLLAPSGSHGFRITTKIHPFWNLYLNGLGFALAEANEANRSDRVHSYRLSAAPPTLFDKSKSWVTYKEATIRDPALDQAECVVVQTDISSFYEHIYHHRLEAIIKDLDENGSSFPLQVDRLLNKLSSGRSFGLPVGGQCARVLAELMLTPIDQSLSEARVVWHRYVDDFTLICTSRQDAYTALSILSNALADYGLSLNRTKTTILSAKHYADYVENQLGGDDDASIALRELDLHFDPYSDNAQVEYEQLKSSFRDLDVQFLLDLERQKSQPDAFVLAQIGRALKFQEPNVALQLCATLLDPHNLDAFRASWSKIMRGVYAVRANEDFGDVFDEIDRLLDDVPSTNPHLLKPEANLLHFLRAVRFKRTDVRGAFVRQAYEGCSSQSIKRACIDCWRHWRDRASFTRLRNRWSNLGPDEQRMLWLAAARFGDEGDHARKQLRRSLGESWRLGFETQGASTFASCYEEWARRAA